MTPALTVKSQVTIPKVIRTFLGLHPGERVSFKPLPDCRVAILPANRTVHPVDNSVARFSGVLKSGMTTDEVMRMTRGDDWNKP